MEYFCQMLDGLYWHVILQTKQRMMYREHCKLYTKPSKGATRLAIRVNICILQSEQENSMTYLVLCSRLPTDHEDFGFRGFNVRTTFGCSADVRSLPGMTLALYKYFARSHWSIPVKHSIYNPQTCVQEGISPTCWFLSILCVYKSLCDVSIRAIYRSWS